MGYLIEEDLCTVSTTETVQKQRAAPTSSGRTCVVVDCELANCLGDLWAIAYLLSAPNVDLRYVLATGGDTRAKLRVISKFLAHCGRADVEGGACAESKMRAPSQTVHTISASATAETSVAWLPGRGGATRPVRAVAGGWR